MSGSTAPKGDSLCGFMNSGKGAKLALIIFCLISYLNRELFSWLSSPSEITSLYSWPFYFMQEALLLLWTILLNPDKSAVLSLLLHHLSSWRSEGSRLFISHALIIKKKYWISFFSFIFYYANSRRPFGLKVMVSKDVRFPDDTSNILWLFLWTVFGEKYSLTIFKICIMPPFEASSNCKEMKESKGISSRRGPRSVL